MPRPLPLILITAACMLAADLPQHEFRVLATTKTSTMEKEMNQAAEVGFRFVATMGGETAFGGKETVVTMSRVAGTKADGLRYLLLATSRTATMQKEISAAAQEGFVYRGQTVFESAFGGREVGVVMERDPSQGTRRDEYLLLATSKTSTMQKELDDAGQQGYELAGMTLGKTAMRGGEVVCILRRAAR